MARASASAPNSASATGSGEIAIGATVCRTGQPDVTGTVVARPQEPLVRVEWPDYTLLHWIDDLTVVGAPRKLSLRERLRREFTEG
jgi:hypothetical protein